MNLGIEVIGLCGAGKTTLLNKLTACIEAKGETNRIYYEQPKHANGKKVVLTIFVLFVRAFLKHPTLLLRYYQNYPGWWLFRKIGYRLAAYRTRNLMPNSLMLDCGLLQPLISCPIGNNVTSIYLPLVVLVDVLPLPKAVIHISASSINAFERYSERDKVEQRLENKTGLKHRFENAVQLEKELLELLKGKGVEVFTVNANFPDEYHDFMDLYNKIISLK